MDPNIWVEGGGLKGPWFPNQVLTLCIGLKVASFEVCWAKVCAFGYIGFET